MKTFLKLDNLKTSLKVAIIKSLTIAICIGKSKIFITATV